MPVPSCRDCNVRWKKIEEEIGRDFMMIFEPNHPAAAGVYARLSRGWDASRAHGEEDARHRLGLAKKLMRTMAWAEPAQGRPQVAVEYADGSQEPASPARGMDQGNLNAITEKFVRGVNFAETGSLLGDIDVGAFMIPNEHLQIVNPRAAELDPSLLAVMRGQPIETKYGCGFWHRHPYTLKRGALWGFLLWGHIEVLACVLPRTIVLAR